MVIRARWRAEQDGMITAPETHVVTDAGAYAYTSTTDVWFPELLLTPPRC